MAGPRPAVTRSLLADLSLGTPPEAEGTSRARRCHYRQLPGPDRPSAVPGLSAGAIRALQPGVWLLSDRDHLAVVDLDRGPDYALWWGSGLSYPGHAEPRPLDTR